MEGVITITDKRGGIILNANIWTVVLMQALSSKWGIMPGEVRLFIDGTEIDKPEWFNDHGERG